MIAFSLAMLFSLAALQAAGAIGAAIASALPRVRNLQRALRDCPETREMRFTVREVMVTPAHAKVVALPVRFRSAASSQPLLAAA